VLHTFAKQQLKPPLSVGEAVRMVAKLGGCLEWKNDPPPGHQLMWQGFSELFFMYLGFELRDD